MNPLLKTSTFTIGEHVFEVGRVTVAQRRALWMTLQPILNALLLPVELARQGGVAPEGLLVSVSLSGLLTDKLVAALRDTFAPLTQVELPSNEPGLSPRKLFLKAEGVEAEVFQDMFDELTWLDHCILETFKSTFEKSSAVAQRIVQAATAKAQPKPAE